jgi:hypothetical protein
MASQAWVKQRSIKILREDPNIGAKALQKKLHDTYNVQMGYHTVWKGKEKSIDKVFGTWGIALSSFSTSKQRWKREIRAVLWRLTPLLMMQVKFAFIDSLWLSGLA